MSRRNFLLALVAIAAGTTDALAANKKFVFKIRTKSGGIVGNILIEAPDQFAAVAKLMKRYPGCEILEGKEKRGAERNRPQSQRTTARRLSLKVSEVCSRERCGSAESRRSFPRIAE